MNVTELARKLNIRTEELLNILPEFGFDIGRKAIKVDDRVAQKIIISWKKIKRELERRKEEEIKKKKEEEKLARKAMGLKVSVPQVISVRDFAAKLNLSVNKIIMELMKNGVLAAQNENIDFDTASIVAADLGFEVEKEAGAKSGIGAKQEEAENILSDAISKESAENFKERAPVIVIMGHVDHGKTTLLDTIRKANVAGGEEGGITQHIGAYQVLWKKEKQMTFIDTPGHEAFSIMRSRGAKVADIAVLVVAADDGVKPQTLEALNIIKAARIPFVIAINKIDREGANPDRVRTELAQADTATEKWGGQIPEVEISAKKNLNIDKLLDTLLLVAEMNAEKIKANFFRPAIATVIEAHVDKGEGPVATVLVHAGTLKINDPLVINNEIYGKVRAMKNSRGESVAKAPPGFPARVLGFKVVPQVGDILNLEAYGRAVKVDIKSKVTIQKQAEKPAVTVQESEETREEPKKFLPVILKADVLGSLEAVIGSMEKFKHEEVGVKIIGKGLGNVTEDDVKRAGAAGGAVYAFNVIPTPEAQKIMEEQQVQIHEFKIIYDLLNNVKEELERLLNPEKLIIDAGTLKVLKIFRKNRKSAILGCIVESGNAEAGVKLKIKRAGAQVGEGVLESVQVGKSAAVKVESGRECGVAVKTIDEIFEGDILTLYKEETKARKIAFKK